MTYLYKFIIACLVSGIIFAQDLYDLRLDLGGYYFTDKPHWGGICEAYIPLIQDNTNLLYSDVRGIFKNDGKSREINAAVGFRKLWSDADRIFGGYVYYDNKNTANNNTFQQTTFGLEAWFNKIFWGANFYLPIGEKSKPIQGDTLQLGSSGELITNRSGLYNILITQVFASASEVSLIGADTTFGYQLYNPLTLYAGIYYFHSSTKHIHLPTILGPMLHLRYILNVNSRETILKFIDRCNIDSQLQYDHLRKWRWYMGVTVGFTYKRKQHKLSVMQRHMTEYPLRDIDVVSRPKGNRRVIVDVARNADNSPITVFLPAEGQDPGVHFGNKEVQVISVNGSVTNFDNKRVLGEGQVLTGGDHTVCVRGEKIRVKTGINGEIRGNGEQPILTVGRDTVVENIRLNIVPKNKEINNNIAIQLDSNVDYLGTINIDGVVSNGRLELTRDGLGQSANIVIHNSAFISRDAPNNKNSTCNAKAVAAISAKNNSNIDINITDSVFIAKYRGYRDFYGIKFDASNGASININNITNNKFKGTTGIYVFMHDKSNSINVHGNIRGNRVKGSKTRHNAFGMLVDKSVDRADFKLLGSICNNCLGKHTIGPNFVRYTSSGLSCSTH